MVQTRLYAVLIVVSALALALAGCPSDKPADSTASTGPAAGGAPPTAPAGEPAPTAPAEGAAPTAEAPAGALTAVTVKAVMASMEDKAVSKIMDGIVDGLGVKDEDSPEALKMAMDKAAQSAELSAAVKAHGFADAAEWADAVKRVLPGMGPAMEKVLVEMMGPDVASKGTKGGDDEYKEFTEAFGEPSEADIAVIAEVVKAQMEAEHGSGAKAAP